jgi:hypothetical protein
MTNILASGANIYGDRLGLEVSADVEINCDRDITGDDGVLHSDHHSEGDFLCCIVLPNHSL